MPARRAQLGAQAGPTLNPVIDGPSGTGTGTFTGTRAISIQGHALMLWSGGSMATLVFVANRFGAEKRIEVPEGGDIVDIADQHFAPIPFSCRSASCGTCQVEVLEGEDLLEPQNDAERDLIPLLGGKGRLACQARVKPNVEGVIKLRSVLAT
jgi:ferredoxin